MLVVYVPSKMARGRACGVSRAVIATSITTEEASDLRGQTRAVKDVDEPLAMQRAVFDLSKTGNVSNDQSHNDGEALLPSNIIAGTRQTDKSAKSYASIDVVSVSSTFGVVDQGKGKKDAKNTYNSGYSLVVTHLTTNPPVRCLNRAERTGSLVFNVLWSYVEEESESYTYNPPKRLPERFGQSHCTSQ
jgi:hypothetical protein